MNRNDDPKRMSSGAYIYYNHWLSRETVQFNNWWEQEYPIMDVLDTADDFMSEAADEYYVRRSFALMGWLGAIK